MLRLPPFTYRRPTSLSEAAQMLAGEGAATGRARLLAGGTDLLPNLKRRHQQADVLVALGGVPGLAEIHLNGSLRLGAMAKLASIEHHPGIQARYPALVRAVAAISSPPLRHQGTLGGNLAVDTRCTYYNQTEEWRQAISYCMKEAGTVCWVAPSSPRCWAHAASDSAPMLAALDARVTLTAAAGEREIPLEDLYRDDGMAYLTKPAEEILTAVEVPGSSDATRVRSAFWKLRRRGSIDFAVLSVGTAVWLDGGGTVTRARVFLGAVASAPVNAEEVSAALVGRPLDAGTITTAAALARKQATPMDNTDFQAQWRGAVLGRYVEAALRECAGLPAELLPAHHP